MRLKVYEIKVGNDWEKVRGTTLGMKPGWLSWNGYKDKYEVGISRPGQWRELAETASSRKSTDM